MQHNRDSYACAEICRAGGEISEARAEGILDVLLNHIVDFVYHFGASAQQQASHQDLDSQVVFFVYHSSEGFAISDDGTSRPFAEGVMPAYQVPFD